MVRVTVFVWVLPFGDVNEELIVIPLLDGVAVFENIAVCPLEVVADPETLALVPGLILTEAATLAVLPFGRMIEASIPPVVPSKVLSATIVTGPALVRTVTGRLTGVRATKRLNRSMKLNCDWA